MIPGNDDAIRSCDLVTRVVADGIAAGRTKVTSAEMTQAATPAAEEEPPAAEAGAEDAPAEATDEPELEPAAVAEGGET